MKKLTDEQKQIVFHVGGHALVKAVPGSGKSSTLVMRIKYLIEHVGVNPRSILVLMFNKQAAKDFNEKLYSALPKLKIIPQARTFHSFSNSIIRRAESRKLFPKKTIIQNQEFKYKAIVKESFHFGRTIKRNYYSPTEIENFEILISKLKANNVSTLDLMSDSLFEDIKDDDKKSFGYFVELMNDQGLRTFDDLLIDAVSALELSPTASDVYEYIVVDEYQDVNFIQHTLIRLLASKQGEVMAVGDSNQCIYEWRGSKTDFIEGLFEKHFSNTSVYNLSCTFRYGHQISMIANALIKKNFERLSSLCVSHPNTPKSKVFLHKDESLLSLLDKLDCEKFSTAILARSRSSLVESALYLRLINKPYSFLDKKIDLSDRTELGCVVFGFAIALNNESSNVFADANIQKYLKGFLRGGDFGWKTGESKSLEKKLRNSPSTFLSVLSSHLCNGSDKNRLMLDKLLSIKGCYSPDSQALTIFKTLLSLGFFRDIDNGSVVRQEANNRVKTLEKIQLMLERVDIRSDDFLKVLTNEPDIDSSNCILSLSTIHGAKGLEWSTVVLVGLEDKEFPGKPEFDDYLVSNHQTCITGETSHEERRLFYVAVTRAIHQLHLVIPEDETLHKWLKNKWSSSPKKAPIATRFIYECDLANAKAMSEQLYVGKIPDTGSAKFYGWYMGELAKLG